MHVRLYFRNMNQMESKEMNENEEIGGPRRAMKSLQQGPRGSNQGMLPGCGTGTGRHRKLWECLPDTETNPGIRESFQLPNLMTVNHNKQHRMNSFGE